ncbi:putative permease [Archaeoglobus sulfaticallidus PM70-1]|uniref:Putative permease n=2 Tax=Archaeoglobus TaxID=2233 RepID=N0BJZ7_9EURY|nr:putative permease [Archaeoglobus sulfaticallidus PM70-1]
MRSDRIKPDKWILMLFIGIVATLSLMVYFFSPLLDGILMGVAFSYVAKPIKKKLDTKMNKNVSSLIATLIILVPVSILLFYGIFQGIMQAANIITHQKEFQDQIIDILKDSGLSEYYIKQIESFIPNILSFISKNILQMSAIDLTFKIISFVMNFFISMVVCFYALADGDTFIKKSLRIIPDEYRTKFGNFIEEVDNVFLGLWFGNFAVAVLIGIASIPFFLAFNIPYTALLSGLIFLAALIPVFAEWMVLIPVTIYIALQSVHAAIWFIVLGAIFLYILPELILRPYLLSYTSRIHPLIILLSFIGGGMVAGVTGFFLAPMIAGLVTAIYNIYTR